MKLSEIAEKLNLELIGDPDLEIKEVSGLDTAGPGTLTYIKHKKFLPRVIEASVSAFITEQRIEETDIAQLISDNALLSFAQALELFYTKQHKPLGIMKGVTVNPSARISKTATVYPGTYISDGVQIGERSIIYPNVFIGEGAVIGNDTVIFPNVTIMDNVTIGSRVRVHAGAVIGSDGFGYIFHEGKHHKIPQVGRVVIEDDVEIGAGVTIDRATTGITLIGEGTKIDNLVQIAHNVKIGRHCIVVAQVGIAGSTEIGNFVTLAGQAGVADHATIEEGTIVTAQSGLSNKRYKKGVYSGTPAMEHSKWLRASILFERLPEMEKRLRKIEKLLSQNESPEKTREEKDD